MAKEIKTIQEVLKSEDKTLKRNFKTRDLSDYDYIELTEEETLAAIRYKKMLKAIAIEDEQKIQARRERRIKMQAPWSADELRTEIITQRIQQLKFDFVFDEHNKGIFALLCMYFSGDEKFNQQDIIWSDGTSVKGNLKKGIGLLSSVKGTGKTIMMKLFQNNKFRPYIQIDATDVATSFNREGVAGIAKYSNLLHIMENPLYYFFTDIGVCFDDLGNEVPKAHYATKSDVMSEVIFDIYRKNQDAADFSWFHFTSNLSGKSIGERYGDRIRDRMREMFNLIPVSGPSRRK